MKNPIKVMLIAVLVISVITLALVLLKKEKIVLEDETGQRYVGYSAKLDIDKTPDPDED